MKVQNPCAAPVAAMLGLALSGCGTGEGGPHDGFELGIKISEDASAMDVGLPIYPGSVPHKDRDDDGSAANVGLTTPLFGLKVLAAELETEAEPEKVAAFYRKALSKYGQVVECGPGSERRDSDGEEDGGLKCDPDDFDGDSIVYKVGTEEDQRIVAMEPHGEGTKFSLVHVATREGPAQ